MMNRDGETKRFSKALSNMSFAMLSRRKSERHLPSLPSKNLESRHSLKGIDLEKYVEEMLKLYDTNIKRKQQ